MIKQYLTITVILFSAIASAQLQRNYTSYTVNNGLAQNSVWDAFQDYRGYMWFGTADGISRFDSQSMKQYKYSKTDSNSLTGVTNFRFFEDKDRVLWISHNKGISRYNRVKDNFTNITFGRKDHFSAIIGEDKKGNIWLLNGAAEMICMNKKSLVISSRIKIATLNYQGISSRDFCMVGSLVYSYLGKDINTWFCFDINTKKISTFKVADEPVNYFFPLNDSLLCSLTYNYRYILNTKNNSVKKQTYNGIKFQDKEGAAASSMLWNNRVYIGNPSGLYVFNKATNTIEEHIQSFEKFNDQGFFYVQKLMVDKSNNLWICTNGNGVKCLSRYQNKFKHYSTNQSRNSLIKGICTGVGGTIYTGVWGQDLIWYDKSGKSTQYHFKSNPKEISSVLAITPFNDELLMLTNRQYVYLFNPIAKKITAKFDGLFHKEALSIGYPHFLKLKNGNWLMAADYGIHEISSQFKPRSFYALTTRDTMITTINMGQKNQLWVGTVRGLYIYDTLTKQQKSLPVNIIVKCICMASNNTVWVGGGSGLFHFTIDGKLINEYDISDGLPDDFIYGILEDKHGCFWMSHNKGMSVYNPQTKTFKHYGIKDGLQSNEFNTGAYYKDEKGLLYFGGVNGINVIDPNEINDNKNLPQIAINKILLGDLPYKTDTAYNEITQLQLSYLENTLSFDFSALEFSQPQDNMYQYKLEGYDNNWIESGKLHFARYANLPPGKYSFKIKAANGDGYWNPQPRELYINIVPPFWQRSWFYLLLVLIVLISVIGIVYYLINRQKTRMQRELDVQQKLEEERLRISRDLHDNVGAQLSFLITNVEWMLQHPEQVNEAEEKQRLQALSETGRHAILTLRQTIWAISHTALSVDDFADRFKQFALKMVEFNKSTQLHFSENFEQPQTLSPSVALNLFRICQEAFNNSLKHAQAKNINLHFACNKQHSFLFTITDDGVGFDWNDAINKGHYGLHNIKARATETNAELQIQSQIGKGTTLKLTVK